MAQTSSPRRGGNAPPILESGEVFFAYRPRVRQAGEPDRVDGPDDVQRFYMILRPDGVRRMRLTIIGRKRLPFIRNHERVWGFVDLVAPPRVIADELGDRTYRTRTRGVRHDPAARPCGEGVYEFVRPDRGLRFAYELALPRQLGPVQEALNIQRAAAFVISIKNPEAPSPPRVGLRPEERAKFPPSVEENEFRGRRFEGEDPSLLDMPGTEFVLIGAHYDPENAYDIDIPVPRERPEDAEVIRELGLPSDPRRLEPLRSGRWA